MPGDRKFDLGDYVEVKDRIRILYELYPQARLVTDEVTMLTAPDNKQRVMVKALAYRNPDDTHPGVGYSWMELPGTTSYTKGSELENTETSAWGRAIASLGILIDASIATAQEVDNKQRETDEAKADAPPRGRPKAETLPPYAEEEEMLGRKRARGIIRKGTAEGYKLDARIGPEGHAIGFRLEISGDKSISQCLVAGPLGEVLYKSTGEHPDALKGIPATVTGILYSVRANRPGDSWYRLHVDRIETTINGLDVILPADEALPEPPEDVPLVAEGEGLGLAS